MEDPLISLFHYTFNSKREGLKKERRRSQKKENKLQHYLLLSVKILKK
jgi:hypothetical protein